MSEATATAYRPLVNLGDDFAGRESSGDGEALLWLHPYGLDSSCWGGLWDALPGFHHVGVDLPGHGRSMPLPDGQDARALAGRLLALAERRGARHLVALSAGTILALEMAAQKPSAFQSLVLGSPLPPDGAAGEPFWPRYRELVNMRHIGGFGEHLRGRLMLVEPNLFQGVAQGSPLWDGLWEIVGRHPFFDLEDGAWTRLGQEPDEVRLHAVRTPTLLFVGGRETQAGRRHAQRLAQVLPDCRRVDVVAASRLSLLEAPQVAAPAIEGHVRAAGRGEDHAGGEGR